MIVFGVILLIVAMVCFYLFREDFKKNNGFTKKGFLIFFAMFLAGAFAFCMIVLGDGCDSSSGSAWSNLSDDEKDWYHKNYGDGKSDAYDDAIKNYK